MEKALSVLSAIILAEDLGRARLRPSQGRRAVPGSDGASPYQDPSPLPAKHACAPKRFTGAFGVLF